MSHNVQRINLESANTPKLEEKSKGGIVMYGNDNLYPKHMIDYYDRSPVHSSIINLKAFLTAGRGLEFDGAPEGWEKEFGYNRHIDKILKQISLDYALHRNFNLQVIWKKDPTQGFFVKYEDASFVRKGVDADGEFDGTYHLSRQWKSSPGSTKGIKILPEFNPKKAHEQKNQLYRYEGTSPGTNFYPKPEYCSAFDAIAIDIAYTEFHLNNIENGFLPSIVFEVMGPEPDPEKKDDFKRHLKKNLMGTKGKKHIIVWTDPENNSFNGSGFKVHTVENKNNDGRYISVDRVNTQKIMTAHRLSTPTLAAIPGAGSLGGNANEIRIGFELFHGTVIKEMQDSILEGFQDMLDRGGYEGITAKIINIDPFTGLVSENTDEEEITETEKP